MGVQSSAIMASDKPGAALAVGLWLLCRDANNITQVLSEKTVGWGERGH